MSHITAIVDYLGEVGFQVTANPDTNEYLDRNKDVPSVFTALPSDITDAYASDDTYHSGEHALAVANIAMAIIGKTWVCKDNEYWKDETVSRAAAVILAAMYHDVGHSLGKTTDRENIEVAVGHLKAHLAKAEYLQNKSRHAGFYNMVESLIRSTLFVYGNTRYSNSVEQSILMDADMLYLTVSNNSGEVYHKLAREMNGGNEPSVELMDKGYWRQIQFMAEVKLFTANGQYLFGKNFSQSLSDIRDYIRLYKPAT